LKTWIVTVVLIAAAILEVGGDAVVRVGLHGHRSLVIALGFVILGSYGIVVNLLPLDFSRLLGAYVGFFAVVSVVFGRLVFREPVLLSTWAGLALILAGSFVIQHEFRWTR
jgi:drug/metabolite transporter superfamily protein YnfA